MNLNFTFPPPAASPHSVDGAHGVTSLRSKATARQTRPTLSVSRLVVFYCLFLLPSFTQAQDKDVLTYHNDKARTGQYLVESTLTPANVNSSQFGKLWVLKVDGHVDGQPLYVSGVKIPGQGLRNVVYVVTEHDSVYAFDADSTNLFWHVSVLGDGETTAKNGCGQVSPQVGITSAPVIDRQLRPDGTIFVTAMSVNGDTYHQRLHALDLATGADTVKPAEITASYPGRGDNSSDGRVIFDPKQYEDRSGLLLLNGVIYTAWASHCDIRPYTGWIMGYDEHTLAQTSVLNLTPNGRMGAIWMGNTAIAADTGNNIVFLDANGTFNPNLNTAGFPVDGDYGNAFLKLSTSNNVLSVADYFATSNTVSQSDADQDLGSGGAVVLPDMVDTNGVTRHLAVGAGKDNNLYVVDLDHMGKFDPDQNAIYQEVNHPIGSCFSMAAYYKGTLYYGSIGWKIKAFEFKDARLVRKSSQTPETFSFPGVTPSISANGDRDGILWAVENASPGVLHAYDASDLAHEFYNSNEAANGRDHYGEGLKYVTPMIANGKVYVGSTKGVGVFGLLNEAKQ